MSVQKSYKGCPFNKCWASAHSDPSTALGPGDRAMKKNPWPHGASILVTFTSSWINTMFASQEEDSQARRFSQCDNAVIQMCTRAQEHQEGDYQAGFARKKAILSQSKSSSAPHRGCYLGKDIELKGLLRCQGRDFNLLGRAWYQACCLVIS